MILAMGVATSMIAITIMVLYIMNDVYSADFTGSHCCSGCSRPRCSCGGRASGCCVPPRAAQRRSGRVRDPRPNQPRPRRHDSRGVPCRLAPVSLIDRGRLLANNQVVRFLFLGGFAAAVNWLIRFPLSLFLPLSAAVAVAYLIGMSVGFTLYRTYVFPVRPALSRNRPSSSCVSILSARWSSWR